MTIRIGITGPIGCGKSTVARWLGDLGARVIDADVVAREVTAPGGPALAAVLALFGDSYRLADGSLDRAALGRLVFSNPEALEDLEEIVHPAVRSRIDMALSEADADDAPAVVIEAIKLIEGGLAAVCDEIWLVNCEAVTQRKRLIGRGTTREDAAQRIAAQDDPVDRLRDAATRILDTSGGIEETRRLVADAWAEAVSG